MTTKTRDLSDLLDANGDVKSTHLDNVPDSTNASALSSGTVAPARLGSGTASSTTFLAGDSSFKTISGTTINNNANNRVITGSDSSNTLEGEANLTFDGTHLNLGDNQNIQIGASNDLQLFHNASDSFVQDAGTGVLKLRGNSKVEINQYSDDEKMAVFNIDGAAELYHNGSKKIETTSGGVDVTGAITVNGSGLVTGKIGQVINVNKVMSTTAITSTSSVAIANYEATITPTSTSSKIFVLATYSYTCLLYTSDAADE